MLNAQTRSGMDVPSEVGIRRWNGRVCSWRDQRDGSAATLR